MHNESIETIYNKIKELQQQLNSVVEEIETMRTADTPEPTEKVVSEENPEVAVADTTITQPTESSAQTDKAEDDESIFIPILGRKGVFDGIFMITDDGKKFQVPPNYVSKSMLVVGDMLEIVEVDDTGSKYSFKQTKNVERKELEGILTKKDNQWAVHTNEGIFYVVAAAVRFHKADVGDVVAIQLPAGESMLPVEWAAFKEIRKQSMRENFEPRAKQYQHQTREESSPEPTQSTTEDEAHEIVKSRLSSPVAQPQEPPAPPQVAKESTATPATVPSMEAKPVEEVTGKTQTGEVQVSESVADEPQSGEIQVQEDDLWELR